MIKRALFFETNSKEERRPIILKGLFSSAELEAIDGIFCDDFYKYVHSSNLVTFTFSKYVAVGFPSSTEDESEKGKTVLLIDGDVTYNDVVDFMRGNGIVKDKFNKLFTKHNKRMRV